MKSLLAICLINAFVASVHALSPSVALGVKVVDDEGKVIDTVARFKQIIANMQTE